MCLVFLSNINRKMIILAEVWETIVTKTSDVIISFLAHLCTKCSRWVNMIILWPLCVVLLCDQLVNWYATWEKASSQRPCQNSFKYFDQCRILVSIRTERKTKISCQTGWLIFSLTIQRIWALYYSLWCRRPHHTLVKVLHART